MVGSRVKINMVAFLVISLGFSYWLATQVLSSLQDRIQVYVLLEDAGGVFTSQEVTYRGITVGQIGKMSVVGDGVKIELDLNAATKIPKEDLEARVMFKSAVGEQFIDLLPASEGPPYLEDGDEIPQERTTIPVSTQELLTTVEAVLRGVPPEALKGAVDSLGIGLTGRGPDIATIIESSATLAELFAEKGPELERILENGTKVGGEFLESRQDFAKAIHELVTVSDTLSTSTDELERLMRGGNETSREVVALLREHNEGVNRFLHEFAEVQELQAQHGDDISELLRWLPPGLLGVVNTFEADTGLVRFSLVQDNQEPACSYGTARRQPSNRAHQPPPKDARCPGGRRSTATSGTSSEQSERAASSESALLPGVDRSAGTGDAPVLPAHMSEWSWTLFYLNAV